MVNVEVIWGVSALKNHYLNAVIILWIENGSVVNVERSQPPRNAHAKVVRI